MADFCGFLVILGRLWRVLWAEQGGVRLFVGPFGAVFARTASLVVLSMCIIFIILYLVIIV